MSALSQLITYLKIYRPTREGFTPLRAKAWMNMVKRDNLNHPEIPAERRKWAHNHGFMVETAESFGLHDENCCGMISQKDYMYLYPLNGSYIHWLSDAVTIRNIFKPFSDHLIPCYFQFETRDGELFIIGMQDLPDGYDCTLEGVCHLIDDQGGAELIHARCNRYLFLRPEDGGYSINGKKKISREELGGVLQKYAPVSVLRPILPDCQKMNPGEIFHQLELYIVNPYGDNPEIGQAVLEKRRVLDMSEDDPKIQNEEYSELSDEIDDHDEQDLLINQMTRAEFLHALRELRSDRTETESVFPLDLETGKYTDEDGTERAVPQWKTITDYVQCLCRFVPELEYFDIRILFSGSDFYVTRMTNTPPYPVNEPFSPVLTEYLNQKLGEKKAAFRESRDRRRRGLHKAKLKIRKMFTRLLYPAGMKPYLGVTWIHDVIYDFFHDHSVPMGTKLWGYRRGFFSYRIPQYGITKENHDSYISDFEYKWLRHINNRYRTWLEDKITIKYIASDFRDCFPEYYFYTVQKNKVNKVIAMMDLPNGYGTEFEDILNLAREKGDLALKRVTGSHGNGFYRLSWKNGKYLLNGERANPQEIHMIIMNPETQYLITEFIQSHPQLQELYDGAVSTLRFLVFKKDGRTPEMHDCYMRVGTSATGAVDNIGAGGMFVNVDIRDGHYSDAALMVNNNIIPTPYHPDTGKLIEGYIPNWDRVCQIILDVCASIPQMEYMGVDAAITPDGVKFPEINRYPDFPRMDALSPETMDYLLYKLQKKKERYGYDVNRPRKLITLPKRRAYTH